MTPACRSSALSASCRSVATVNPMTAQEVAEALGVSLRTVQRMAEDGRLTPVYKLPGSRGAYLFDRPAVDQLAARRKAEAA